MLNKVESFLKQYHMLQPGDRVICAVSGGADSMALLWALYLLREELGVTVCAAHYNHHLRGMESDRDETFVRDFCCRFEIAFYSGGGKVTAGEKGLEAAARDARYAFLNTLPGKIATAHTADDNAETVLLHMVRGTGLKGLGAIAPVNGKLIRPMLSVTREDVESFLEEYHISHVEDSSNHSDQFLRNRIRRQVMPALKMENPRLSENLSAMALRLREDESVLSRIAVQSQTQDIKALRQMPQAVRRRVLGNFLRQSGVREPEAEHIALAEALVFSDNPSAAACFPCDVVIARRYDSIGVLSRGAPLQPICLPHTGSADVPELGLRIHSGTAERIENGREVFTVVPQGQMVVRARRPGDTMRSSGGTKSLKKRFIDEKIPAAERLRIPVLADDAGILGVYGMGVNLDRSASGLPAVRIWFEHTDFMDG